MLLFAAFFIFSNNAFAADDGEYVWFRIDSELNTLIANKGTLTIRWYCTGASTFGQVNDATASESTNSADGIIKIASASKEMTDASCTIGGSETLRASASIDGWVVETWTASSFPGASTTAPFATGASLDYTIVVNGVDDELGNSLTFDGTSASASYDGTVASSSYSGGKMYIAGSATGGYVYAYQNGYVRSATTTTLTVSGTASESVDFGTDDTSTHNESGLPFAHKILVTLNGGAVVTEGVVTAGDSYGVTCTYNTGGYWYCAVPLAETGVSAQHVHDNWNTGTATYTDRTTKAASQTTATIYTTRKAPAGGGGTSGGDTTPTPTPEVSATPTPSVSATPTPSVSPSVSPVVTTAKLYRKVSDPKVYVQGADGTLTWVKTLEAFNAAGYKWSDVQAISGDEFAKLKVESVSAAKLYRKTGDQKVYAQGANGALAWVKTLEAFNSAGYNWADVQVISGSDFNKMTIGGKIKVVSNIGYLNVRASAALSGKLVTKVLSGQEFEFSAVSNGWYKIWKDGKELGWVSGKYVLEI